MEAETPQAALDKIRSADDAFDIDVSDSDIDSRSVVPAGNPEKVADRVIHEHPVRVSVVVAVRRASGRLEMLRGTILQAGRNSDAAEARVMQRITDGLQPDDPSIDWDRPGFLPESVIPGSFGVAASGDS